MATYTLGIVIAYLLMTQTADAANCGFNTCDFDEEYCDQIQGECEACALLCAIAIYEDNCQRLCPGYYNILHSSPTLKEKTTTRTDKAIKNISPNVTTEPALQQTNGGVTFIVLLLILVFVLIVSVACAVWCLCIKNGCCCESRKV